MIAFIHINLWLITSYCLFAVAQKLAAFVKVKSSPNGFLRCAQCLIIFALVVPLLFKLIPEKQLPITQEEFKAFPEEQLQTSTLAKTKFNSFVKKAPVKLQALEKKIDIDLKTVFISLWIIGLLFFAVKFLKNYYQLKNLIQSATVWRRSAKLKIVISDDITVPFSVKMLSSYWVVIPIELLSNKKDLQFSIRHEVQHHRQGDTIWALFIELLICFFYFNPAVYLWKNAIIEFQEFSCDEALTGQEELLSHDYGNCLLRVAETALTNRQMYAGTTSMAVVFKDSKYFKTFLLRRIEMIVEKKRSTQKWVPICTGVVIGLITMAFAFGAEKIARSEAIKINPGKIIVDTAIQKISDDILANALKKANATSGFVIVSDPTTGQILAIANMDLKNKRPDHWAISELMEPASFSKVLIVARALENKVTTPEEMHSCENSNYLYKGRLYHDWKSVGWDKLSTSDTIGLSSDICSLKIGEKVGAADLEKMLPEFGFGANGSAQDFPEARVGLLPQAGDHFIPQIASGFGGFRSSTLEILQAYSAIANGGNLMKPIMANSNDTQIVRRILSPKAAKEMREILHKTVESGNGSTAASKLYTTAGKTATARLNNFMSKKTQANFAGFVGFAPVTNPKIQIFVGINDPDTDHTGAHGRAHAGPVFREVADSVLTYLKVAPDKM